jgi:hypothetical protein
LDVRAWNDTTKLYYYKSGVSFPFQNDDMWNLFGTGTGTCLAWKDLFGNCLLVHGISSAWVTATPKTNTVDLGFIVRKWAPQNNGSYPAPFQWIMNCRGINGDMVPTQPGDIYGEMLAEGGINGQGGIPSERIFLSHSFIKFGTGNYYDPSYGVKYTSADNFEANALDGFYNYKTNGVNSSILRRRVRGTGGVNLP